MQSIIQIICTNKASKSLRGTIGGDTKHLGKHGLFIKKHKKKGRASGWSKIHGYETNGALNIEWDFRTKILLGRAVTKGTIPSELLGRFITYMLDRHASRIVSISILPE